MITQPSPLPLMASEGEHVPAIQREETLREREGGEKEVAIIAVSCQ